MLRKLLSFICCILFLTLLNTAGAAGRGTILFVPLDNRPVCLEYSVNSMQAAGWNVETPPEEYIASNHRSGNPDKMPLLCLPTLCCTAGLWIRARTILTAKF